MNFKTYVKCRLCHNEYEIECNKEDYDKWKSGKGYIQDILNYLPADQRELLISGTCGKCFDELFPPMGDDEDE